MTKPCSTSSPLISISNIFVSKSSRAMSFEASTNLEVRKKPNVELTERPRQAWKGRQLRWNRRHDGKQASSAINNSLLLSLTIRTKFGSIIYSLNSPSSAFLKTTLPLIKISSFSNLFLLRAHFSESTVTTPSKKGAAGTATSLSLGKDEPLDLIS